MLHLLRGPGSGLLYLLGALPRAPLQMVLHLAARFERLVLERFDALLDRTGGALFGPGGREQRRQQHAGTERDQTGRQGIALGLTLDHLGRLPYLLGALLDRTRHLPGLARHRGARLLSRPITAMRIRVARACTAALRR